MQLQASCFETSIDPVLIEFNVTETELAYLESYGRIACDCKGPKSNLLSMEHGSESTEIIYTNYQHVASLYLLYMYYFCRCSSELEQMVPLHYSWERSTCYSDRLDDFSVTIPKCYNDVYFFPRTARLWNSLPIECFPLAYDLNGCKSRINRHLLFLGSS